MGGTGVRLAVEWSGRFVGTCSLVFLLFFMCVRAGCHGWEHLGNGNGPNRSGDSEDLRYRPQP
jgi:hypothetical protein